MHSKPDLRSDPGLDISCGMRRIPTIWNFRIYDFLVRSDLNDREYYIKPLFNCLLLFLLLLFLTGFIFCPCCEASEATDYLLSAQVSSAGLLSYRSDLQDLNCGLAVFWD